MGKRFEGEVVLITGATSGIGWEAARYFKDEGAVVAGTGRDADRLVSLRRMIDLAVQMDVTDQASVEAGVATVHDQLGRVDVLVNNAGIGLFQPWAETTADTIHGLMDVNLYGVVRVTHQVLPGMLERGGGVIANIASVAGKRAYKNHTAYCATKHALIGWSEGLRCDLQDTPVDVVVVCPPAVRTPFFENAGYFSFDEDHPNLTPMTPQDVAAGILDAVAARSRSSILSGRARVLYALSLVSPGFVDVLRRYK